MRHPDSAGGRYQVDPGAVRSVLAAVDAEPIERYALTNAISAALDAISNTDDQLTDDIIFVLSGIAGDLHDAPARIDAGVARAVRAGTQVLRAVETGDEEMEAAISSASGVVDSAKRFGRRAP